MVHSASVGPIRMPLWSALEHMLSVMTPVNFRWPWAPPGTGASAAIISRPRTRCFRIFASLFARRHEVRGRGACVHDPHAALLAVFRQSEGLGGRARHGDGHVRSWVCRIAHRVIPDRSELGLHTGSILLGGVERGLFL